MLLKRGIGVVIKQFDDAAGKGGRFVKDHPRDYASGVDRQRLNSLQKSRAGLLRGFL